MNQLDIYVISEPVILSLNLTQYYYTFNEQVYVLLTGSNLDTTGIVYVRVGVQV